MPVAMSKPVVCVCACCLLVYLVFLSLHRMHQIISFIQLDEILQALQAQFPLRKAYEAHRSDLRFERQRSHRIAEECMTQ